MSPLLLLSMTCTASSVGAVLTHLIVLIGCVLLTIIGLADERFTQPAWIVVRERKYGFHFHIERGTNKLEGCPRRKSLRAKQTREVRKAVMRVRAIL